MNASVDLPKFYAVIPAAGIGKRMGGDRPKQYLPLLDRPVIEHTLMALLRVNRLEQIVVVIADDDPFWRSLPIANHPSIVTVSGGAERCDSVLNGLKYLATVAREQDWVLVHDVARPCVRVVDIENMMQALQEHPVGGILAVPVSDTVKRVAGNLIQETVDRSQLWQAQTPQMFRVGMLLKALHSALQRGVVVTDEASAMESAGHRPTVYEGVRSNIKITHPDDLALAEYVMLNVLGLSTEKDSTQ